MKSVKLSIREKRILSVCLTAVFFALVYHLVFTAGIKRWSGLKKEILREEIRLRKNLRTIAEGETAGLEYGKYAAYAGMKGSDEEEKALMMRQIEKLAGDAGVYIKQMKQSLQEETKLYKKYAVQLECETDTRKLTKFMYLLQTSVRPLRVEQLRLSALKSSAKAEKTALPRGRILITRVLFLPDSFSAGYAAENVSLPVRTENPYEYFVGEINRDLFNLPGLKKKKPRAKPKTVAKALPADFKLVGIIESGKRFKAIIEDKQNRQTYLLYKGEANGRFKVKEISGEEVTLEYRGRILNLTLKTKNHQWQN